jgi:serine phosphatase RsbU (regulator of sigma subunit)
VQSSVKALFRMTVRHTHDPAAIAEQMAAGLHELTGGMPYATAILARFEQRPPRLTYVNAGHPPGLLLRDGQTVALEPSGLPLGLLPGSTYEAHVLELRPGDIGLLVTDGITEALETSTLGLAERLAGDRSTTGREAPADICERLLREAALGAGPPGVADWQDDRTVMVFQVEATPYGGLPFAAAPGARDAPPTREEASAMLAAGGGRQTVGVEKP